MDKTGETDPVIPDSEDESSMMARILELDIEQFPDFRQNPYFSWQRDGSRYSLKAIQDALRRGLLHLADFDHVVDFGAGGGGPTFLVDQICKTTGGQIEALENDPKQLSHLKKVVPLVPVFSGDGIEQLSMMNGRVSLITAFTFGPDESGDFFAKLAKASSSALRPNGKLVVYSDDKTINAVLDRLSASGISERDLSVVPAQNEGNTYKFVPKTVIIGQPGTALVR
jgi:hypothetical protein